MNARQGTKIAIAVFVFGVVHTGLAEPEPARLSDVQPLPDSTQAEAEKSIRHWEQVGYRDGKSRLPLKTCLAGAGGVAFGGAGAIALAQAPFMGGYGCLYGPLLGGGIGCLGGSQVGGIGQKVSPPPDSNRANHEAYLRGYRRGTCRANLVSMFAGGGATVLMTVASIGALLWYVSLWPM